jgi:rhamnose utilization protein RhaD (predicted bifunctional aldolase and dehydrogenase)/NAD(P)-dependent dehydrogenase (short-subunit alcohol dehydrogenase family)
MSRSVDEVATDLVDDLLAASRAIGSDPRLVLHGGGNTSVKVERTDVTGEVVPVLLVKGSGHDLATIDGTGFAPLRLDRLRALLAVVDRLDDATLANELRCASLDADAPDPSVECLVHALVPQACVLHSHADAILTLTHTPHGAALVRRLYGDKVVVVEYAQPGPALAAACAAAWREQANDATEAIVVLDHGIFAVGDTPRQALERHKALIATADAAIAAAPERGRLAPPPSGVDPVAVAALRRHLSAAAGRPLVVRRAADEEARAFVADPELVRAAGSGVLTPDHVIWTRRVPMVGTDCDAYADAYRSYVAENAARNDRQVQLTDVAPRIVLDPGLGLLAAGRTAGEAAAAESIYRHTMRVMGDALRLGGYEALSPEHVFDLEFWPLQQAKLHRTAPGGPLAGQVAVVTGAASGIGRACAAELLAQGAAVVGWDRSPSVVTTFDGPAWLGLQVDVTDAEAVTAAIAQGVDAFGGLDILVVAAGIFPSAAPLGVMSQETWRKVMAVNVDAVALLYGLAHPLLALAPKGGAVVLIASKNVPAPGPGAAAYSASKAAVTQLSRVAALEWAGDGIRVNMVHPDAVFDTGLWTPELLAARAEHYGLTVDQYKRRNLLHAEVTSADVGRLVVAMAGDLFAKTTGAQVPVDGGNERVV